MLINKIANILFMNYFLEDTSKDGEKLTNKEQLVFKKKSNKTIKLNNIFKELINWLCINIEKNKLKILELIFGKFSELQYLGNINEYTKEEISLVLIKWRKKEQIINNYVNVTWENKFNSITIRYDHKKNLFLGIIQEEWKLYNMKFERQMRKK